MKKTIDLHGRTCNACGEYKKWSNYHTDKHSKTGYVAKCVSCYKGKVPSKLPKRVKVKQPLEGFSQKIQDFCLGIKKAA